MKLFVKAFSWFLEWPLILASSRSGIQWHKNVICKSLYAISNNRENKIEGNKTQERQKAEILKVNKMGIFKDTHIVLIMGLMITSDLENSSL